MRARALFALVLGGCTAIGHGVDPALVGEYQYWFIDVGEAIDLAADGTFIRRGIGITPCSPTVHGRWTSSEGRVVLHATDADLFGSIPFLERLAHDYPLTLTTRHADGALTLVDADASEERLYGWAGMEWTRCEPSAAPR